MAHPSAEVEICQIYGIQHNHVNKRSLSGRIVIYKNYKFIRLKNYTNFMKVSLLGRHKFININNYFQQ